MCVGGGGAAGQDSDVLLLERYNWRSTAYLTGGHSGAVRVITFSPNGKCEQAEVLQSLPVRLMLCCLNAGGSVNSSVLLQSL